MSERRAAMLLPSEANDREAILAEKVGAIRALAKNVVRDVIEIGRHLSEAKAKFDRGENPEFLAWGRDDLGWSQRSFYRFLSVHDLAQKGDFASLAKSDLELSALYLLARPSTANDVRNEVVERAADEEGDVLERLGGPCADKAVVKALASRRYSGSGRGPEAERGVLGLRRRPCSRISTEEKQHDRTLHSDRTNRRANHAGGDLEDQRRRCAYARARTAHHRR